MKMTEPAPIIRLRSGYYVSLAWHGLGQLGFASGEANQELGAWATRLSQLGDAFGFRPPLAGGPLFPFVYQIPGYLDPRDPAELRAVMAAGKGLLRSGSIGAFLDRWPQRTRHWAQWYHGIYRQEIRQSFTGQEEAACEALDAWTEYMELLWPRYREAHAQALRAYPFQDYEERCNALGIFEQWREELALPYPYTEFCVVICPASPTQASSLGPERIVLGAMHAWEQVRHSVVHEIGVRFIAPHLLAERPATASILQADPLGALRLLEAEICYRKPRLLPELEEDGFASGMALQDLLAWRAAQRVEGDPLAAFAGLYARAKEQGLL